MHIRYPGDKKGTREGARQNFLDEKRQTALPLTTAQTNFGNFLIKGAALFVGPDATDGWKGVEYDFYAPSSAGKVSGARSLRCSALAFSDDSWSALSQSGLAILNIESSLEGHPPSSLHAILNKSCATRMGSIGRRLIDLAFMIFHPYQ